MAPTEHSRMRVRVFRQSEKYANARRREGKYPGERRDEAGDADDAGVGE